MPDKNLRIIFAGTPDFAAHALKALINSQHEVIAVYTQPDRPSGRGRKLKPGPVKEVALEHNIPVFQPETLKEKTEQQQITDLKPDIMVVIAYGLLLPLAVLNIPRLGCINVHASILPRWRGAAPIQRAVLSGDRISGVSIMQMDEGLDTGDVLATVTCNIEPEETGGSLHDKLAQLGVAPLLSVLEQLQAGNAHPVPQNNNEACYARKLSKDEAQINWDQPAIEIERTIRAFNPWPVAFTRLNNENMRLWSAVALEDSSNSAPGTIIDFSKNGIFVATGKGVLRIDQLQIPGGRAMTAGEFINAHDLTDTVLG